MGATQHADLWGGCCVREPRCQLSLVVILLGALTLLVTLTAPVTLAETDPLQEHHRWLELLTSVRNEAIDQVLDSSRSDQPFLRANAIEAAENLPRRAVPIIQLGLDDTYPVVRFTAVAVAGKLKLCEFEPAVRKLLNDPSESVRAAAITTLHRCNPNTDLTPITKILTSLNPSSRSNAAMLLGRIGNRSAVPMLKELAKTPIPRASSIDQALARIQIAEAIVRLGDESALNAVRAGAYSQFDEVRILAVTMLGQIGDERMEKAIAQMLLEPPIELQIAAATSLAQLGYTDGLPVVLKASESKIITVRAQAALALSYFPKESAADAILELLSDDQEQVRLSAAAGILRVTATK